MLVTVIKYIQAPVVLTHVMSKLKAVIEKEIIYILPLDMAFNASPLIKVSTDGFWFSILHFGGLQNKLEPFK